MVDTLVVKNETRSLMRQLGHVTEQVAAREDRLKICPAEEAPTLSPLGDLASCTRSGRKSVVTLSRDKTKAGSDSKKLERLLERVARRRDHSAFADLYSSTKVKLFSTSLQIVRRGHLAEEILQDCYARIWLNAELYNPALGSPMNWMITIVRNMSIDVAKKSAWEICPDDNSLLALPCACPDALEELENIEDQESVRQTTQNVFSVLSELDPIKRDLVIAAYILGQSRKQLSEKVGVPESTVKTWLRRTLLEVKQIMRNTENASPAEFHACGKLRLHNDLHRAPLAPLPKS